MSKKKSAFQPFSISFLDCICCGFGAVILLFVLTSGKKSDYRKNELSDMQIDMGKLTRDISIEEDTLKQLSAALKENEDLLQILNAEEEKVTQSLQDKENELSLVLSKNANLEETLAQLLAELEDLPRIEDRPPIPIANPIKRQYLTDFKLDGNRVLILIEASGGMIEENADLAIFRSNDSDREKRQSPKWQRVIKATEWMLTSMRPPTHYQVYFFNREMYPVLPDTSEQWLDLMDRDLTNRMVGELKTIVPSGGANLERAFWVIRNMDPAPDNIILLADGLPTASETYDPGDIIDQASRISMFNAAARQAPMGIPINIILYPWAGDPPAASLFWQLACRTQGSFICPAKSWPNI